MYPDRTCLNYSIGRCPGVCQQKISSEEYHRTLRKVAMVFQGRSDELQTLLEEQMGRYAERLDFESAARIRDQLQGLDQLTADQKMSLPDSSVSRDVLALACNERLAAVQFQMRAGKLVGRLGYAADAWYGAGLILQRVIEEHYSQAVEIPPELLVQHALPQQELLQDWLSEQRERKVQIHCPKQRQKADLIELVQRNAEFELLRAKQGQEQQALATEDLAQLLELPSPPRRIEGYDISHIQGSDAVAPRWCSSWPARQAALPQIQNSQQPGRPQRRLHGHGGDHAASLRRWARVKRRVPTWPPVGGGSARGRRPERLA